MTEGQKGVGESDPRLRAAYDERDRQLRDAHGALAELASALTEELRELRKETAALRDERDRALADNIALRQEVEKQLQGVAELNAQIAGLQEMKVVRWTASLRSFIYRLRGR